MATSKRNEVGDILRIIKKTGHNWADYKRGIQGKNPDNEYAAERVLDTLKGIISEIEDTLEGDYGYDFTFDDPAEETAQMPANGYYKAKDVIRAINTVCNDATKGVDVDWWTKAFINQMRQIPGKLHVYDIKKPRRRLGKPICHTLFGRKGGRK